MSRYSNNSNVKVNGDGNYIGGNVIDNRREYHHHHNKHPRRRDDTNGEVAAIIFTALTAIWFFSKHAYEIYEYIKIGAFVSTLLFILALAIRLLWKPEESKQLYVASYGLLIALMSILLAQYGVNNLDPQLVDIGQQSKNAWIFWNQLNAHGHQLVIGSLTGAMLTGATVIISTLMGAYLLWCTIADSYFEYGYIPRLLTPFRPSIAGVISTVLLVLSWLFTSGYIFQLLK